MPARATAPGRRAAPAAGSPLARVLRPGEGTGTGWLLLVPMLFLVVFLVVPLVFLCLTAFGDGFGTFGDVLGNSFFREALVRTFQICLFTTVLTLVVGTVYALGLALAPTWLRIALLASLVLILWSSLLVRTYGWILVYLPTGILYSVGKRLGLVDQPISIYQTTTAMYPAMVHVMLPLMILPVYASVRRLDVLQIRAAQVMGARTLMVLRRVVLPQLRPGMVAGATLVFLTSFGFFITPQLLGGPDDVTIATIINQAFSRFGHVREAASMSVILVLVVAVVYLVADRLFKVSEQWGQQ